MSELAAFSDWKTVVACATCGRALFRSRERPIGIIPPGHMYAGMEGKETEYHVRPWAALVINRKRAVDYDEVTGKGVGGLVLPDGTVIEATERPTVCSRPCLDGLAASWARAEGGVGDRITADLHPAMIKIGDDLLSRILGSKGEVPELPSDDWINARERERGAEAPKIEPTEYPT